MLNILMPEAAPDCANLHVYAVRVFSLSFIHIFIHFKQKNDLVVNISSNSVFLFHIIINHDPESSLSDAQKPV